MDKPGEKITFTGAIIPLVLFKINNISDRAFKVLTFLFQLETYLTGNKEDGSFFHKEKEIAQEMGCSRETIKRATAELEELGLIIKKRQGLHRGNLICINREYIKDLENQVGTSYKGEKRVEAKKENYTLIAEQKPSKKQVKIEPVESLKNPEPINISQQVIEAQETPLNEATEPNTVSIEERTLEKHPEEDEELIEILFKITGKENEEKLIEEFCNGHNESAELMQHYYTLYKQDKATELDSSKTEQVNELDIDERLNRLFDWYISKGRNIDYGIMNESLDDSYTQTIADKYEYDEVLTLFNDYKQNLSICAA